MNEKPEEWGQELYKKLNSEYLIKCAEKKYGIDEWNAQYLEYLTLEWNRLYPEMRGPIDILKLVKRYSQLKRPNFPRGDFREAISRGVSFTGAHLEGACFWEAHLEGADFRNAHLEGAEFLMAHLEGVIFLETHLEGATFEYAILHGETLFIKNTIDDKTDFTGTALSATRIDPKLRTKLERNIREIRWKQWYHSTLFARLLTPFVKLFWWVSNYGSSTAKVLGVFFAWNIFWALIYQFVLPLLPGPILAGAKTTILQTPDIITAVLQTNLMMFSITDLATEGLDYPALIFVTVHIVIGYFILAALITRLGIMFQNLSP